MHFTDVTMNTRHFNEVPTFIMPLLFINIWLQTCFQNFRLISLSWEFWGPRIFLNKINFSVFHSLICYHKWMRGSQITGILECKLFIVKLRGPQEPVLRAKIPWNGGFMLQMTRYHLISAKIGFSTFRNSQIEVLVITFGQKLNKLQIFLYIQDPYLIP